MGASPEPGQVWELSFGGELVPSLLLQLHGAGERNPRFSVLDLTTGLIEVADVRRWDDPVLDELVGRRLL